jgi:hypothetical protein
LLTAEYALIDSLSDLYSELQIKDDAGIEVTNYEKHVYMGLAIFAIIGPPLFILKSLEIAEESRMGERLSERAPNF